MAPLAKEIRLSDKKRRRHSPRQIVEKLQEADRPLNGARPARHQLSKPVDPAGPLFNAAGVPCQAVVDDVATESLKVDAFTHHLAAYKDVRIPEVYTKPIIMTLRQVA